MLNRHNLNLAKLACKEPGRFTLDGILVSPSCTVVTDGHRLVKMDTPQSKDSPPMVGEFEPLRDWQPFILSSGHALELAKAIPKSKHLPILEHAFVLERGEKMVKMGVTELGEFGHRIFDFALPTGNFPDYERVMPRQEYPFTMGLNGMYVKELMTNLCPMLDERSHFVSLHIKDNTLPVMITARTTAEQQVTALLMPMRPDKVQSLPCMETEEVVDSPATRQVIHDIAREIVKDILVEMAIGTITGVAPTEDSLINLTVKRLTGGDSTLCPPWVNAVQPQTEVIQ